MEMLTLFTEQNFEEMPKYFTQKDFKRGNADILY